jgi:photosystem II stability/assembly factor-like uncharacterized protein
MINKQYVRGLGILLGLLLSQLLFSQRADNWLFGNFGLRFQNDSVLVQKNYALHQNRSIGIISDQYGNLLFYSDGFSVWNKNHELMPNGANITDPDDSNSIQISMVIPKPDSPTIYYIFTADPWNGQAISGLYYSIVDMSLQDGLGDVIQKKIKILDNVTNRITASYHNNLNDIWLIINKQGTNNYYSYLISDSGVSASPVISTAGKSITSAFDGQLKSSPDGKNIACSYNNSNSEGFDLFDFNNTTGELTNSRSFKVPVSYRGCNGLEFSSDATKLFVYQTGSTGESGLFQYDITNQAYDAIDKSRVYLMSEKYNSFMQMQLAPDGKIYITKAGGGGGTEHLGVIEHPNESGKACSVIENGLYLEGASSFVARTPAFIQNYFFKTSFKWSGNCQSIPIVFSVTNSQHLDSVRWKFGDAGSSVSLSPEYKFDLPGTYTVALFAHYRERTDTIIKQVVINPYTPIDLGADTTVCKGYKLSLAGQFGYYLWNTGDTAKSIKVFEDDIYKLTVKNSFGCYSSDSIHIITADLPEINFPDTLELGEMDSIRLDAGDFRSYSWNTGETSSSIYVKNEGWYSVAVKNDSGCMAARSVAVVKTKTTGNTGDTGWIVLNPKPTFLAGSDITFINDQTGFLVTGNELFRSGNGGITWEKMMKITSGKRIAFKNMIGYIIGDNGTIYKSTHMGDGWNKLNVNFTDNLNSVTLLHQDTLRIAGDTKLFASDDGGKTWKTYAIANVDIEDSYFTSSKTGHVACKNGKILKTSDGGLTWNVKLTTNVFPSNFFRIVFVNKNVGYASREFNYIYKTTDGGETWTMLASPDATYEMCFFNENTGFIAGEHGAIHKTTDGGKTWIWKGFYGRTGANDLNSIFFIDEDNGYATGMNGRIIKTINGGTTWSQYALTYNNITQVQFSSSQCGYALSGATLYKTEDKGSNWTSLGQVRPNINTVAMDFVTDSVGFLIGGGNSGTSAPVNTIFKTINGGVTWTATSGLGNYLPEDLYSIDFIDQNTGFASGGYNYNGVFKTVNGGQSWQKIATYSFSQVQFINTQTGYARDTRNIINKIYKTTDGGSSWTTKFEIEEDINSFHFIDENTGFIVGDYSLIYKTTDGGTTWKKLALPYGFYNKIKFCTGNIGYVIDENGRLYQTMDGGLSWKSIYYLPGISSVELREKDIYISGSGGKILKNNIIYDPVTAHVVPVKNPMSHTAILKGIVSSNTSDISDIQFQYGISTSFESSINASPDIITSISADTVIAKIADLQPNTQYYYRIRLKYDGGEYLSSYSTFKTQPEYEINMININIRAVEAVATGRVISNNDEITGIRFQFGTDTLCNSFIDATPVSVSGGSQKEVKGILTLQPETKYYVRLRALYNGKEIRSRFITFSTLPEYSITFYPSVTNGTSQTISAQVTSNNGSIENIFIEYGKTREYNSFVAASPNRVNLNSSELVEAVITGLENNTLYYYRIKAQQGSKSIYSSEKIFKMEGGVLIVPDKVQQVSGNSVIISGLINSNGRLISGIQFEYGPSENFGNSINASPSYVYDRETYNIKATLGNLTPMMKYYFRVKASDGTNSYYSEVFNYTLNETTGIEPGTELSDVSIYPNPTSDKLVIKSPYPVDRVELYDSDGKLREIKTNTNLLDISSYPDGFYFIRIHTNNHVQVRKLIVN